MCGWTIDTLSVMVVVGCRTHDARPQARFSVTSPPTHHPCPTQIHRPKAKKEKSLQSALDNLYGDLAAEPNVGKGGGDIPEDKVRLCVGVGRVGRLG